MEPVSIAISYQAIFRARTNNSKRAVEPAENANADRQDNPNKNQKQSAANKKPSPPDKPVGKSPSTIDQVLFDATLIAVEFEAAAATGEQSEKAELARQFDSKGLAETYRSEEFENKLLAKQQAKTAQ